VPRIHRSISVLIASLVCGCFLGSPLACSAPPAAEHPRLYFDSAELSELRARRDQDVYATMCQNMVVWAEWCQNKEPRTEWIPTLKDDPNYVNLYNRFMQPDINLDTMQIDPRIDLSHSGEMRLPLRWVAILRGQIEASLAATSGIHDHKDVVKLLMAGADVTMIASTILRRGPEVVGTILDDLQEWLQENGYRSVSQFKGGMSYKNCPDAAALERSNYMKALTSYTGPYV
jgi:hypothetical protein